MGGGGGSRGGMNPILSPGPMSGQGWGTAGPEPIPGGIGRPAGQPSDSTMRIASNYGPGSGGAPMWNSQTGMWQVNQPGNPGGPNPPPMASPQMSSTSSKSGGGPSQSGWGTSTPGQDRFYSSLGQFPAVQRPVSAFGVDSFDPMARGWGWHTNPWEGTTRSSVPPTGPGPLDPGQTPFPTPGNPTPSPIPTPTPTPQPGPQKNPLNDWVGGLYQNILGRPAEEGAVAKWIQETKGDPSAIARGVALSPEALGQNQDATTNINELYKAILGRTPENPDVVKTWGGMPFEQALAGILGSQEFQQRKW